MNMTPIKKILIGIAAVCIAMSIITANNLTSVMMLKAARNNAAQNSNAVVQQDQNASANNGGSSSNSGTVNNNVSTTPGGSTTPGSSTNNGGSSSNSGTVNNNTSDSGSSNSGSDAGSSNDAPAGDSAGGATQNGKMPSTKAEIVDYFNTASNKVKTDAKTVTKTHEENYQAQPIDLGALGMVQGMVSGLIDSNMGVNEEQSGRTGSSADEKNSIYPVENEAWASKLTVDDVADAQCTEKDGVYTITLTIVNDPLATEYAHGTGHHGKAFNIVMPQTIKDGAGPAASLLSSLKVGYENGKIEVNVDAATGNIISAKYDFVWLLNIDMFGGITAHFGIKTDYTVEW